MSNTLEKQVYIYSLGTECFYTDQEYRIHKQLLECHLSKKEVNEKVKEHELLLKNALKDLDDAVKNGDNQKGLELNINAMLIQEGVKEFKQEIKDINSSINSFKEELKHEFEKFNGIRQLRPETLVDNKIIGIFDSALSRTIGMKINEVSESLIVVRAFYFNVLEDIILNGFKYNNEDYIYFSSSAGQIRTKKAVFIKKSLWDKHEKSLTCGLTLNDINANDGCNVNKLLAYKALITSASVKWNGFDIDRTIVVSDLESPVTSLFDHIDRDTYEIKRRELTVDIEHTDGCGMILPSKSKKSFMTRLPYVKGLLVPFDFKRFALECENTKVRDIYGKEWDIVEDKIEVILTKSQFKMAKYYSDWNDYKNKFKKYKCQANKLNLEDIGGDATLNYQMLQTLTDITDEELEELCQETNEDLKKVHNDKNTILKVLGATEHNKNKNYFQEGLFIYPELINDNHSKRIIKDKKQSMLNDAYSGKLRINGKYLYLVPDLYAFCEFLFKNIKHPKGLLGNGEVYTNVFNEGKVDILRSPHLYKEHAVREIVKNKEMEEWFITQGIYTSIHDPISRILQFDVDGDKSLVVQNDILIEVAERNMKDIVPLYYEMGVAKAEIVTNELIYNSLTKAFKANIGEVSNNITKIFNSSNEIDLDVVKWLTAENNYIIDYAKTLYMPERPEHVNVKISKAIKGKVPHFFKEAKKKDDKNVESLTNSTVNRLREFVYNKNIKFKDIGGELDYKMLMNEDIEYINHKVIAKFKKLNQSKRWIIRNNGIKNRNEGLLFVYKYIRDEMKTLNVDEDKIVNNLIKDMYEKRNSPLKETLWHCYGDIILSNLRNNLKGTKQCECCGVRIRMTNGNIKYCTPCAETIKKEQDRIADKKYKKARKLMV